MEVTLCVSYTLLCVHTSAFITRGSRGPADLAMALGEGATCCGCWGPQAAPKPPKSTWSSASQPVWPEPGVHKALPPEGLNPESPPPPEIVTMARSSELPWSPPHHFLGSRCPEYRLSEPGLLGLGSAGVCLQGPRPPTWPGG